jgi:hypothetical protein
MANRLPDAFIQNRVGTRYELGISACVARGYLRSNLLGHHPRHVTSPAVVPTSTGAESSRAGLLSHSQIIAVTGSAKVQVSCYRFVGALPTDALEGSSRVLSGHSWFLARTTRLLIAADWPHWSCRGARHPALLPLRLRGG